MDAVTDFVNSANLSALSPAASRLGAAMARPRIVAVGCVVGLTALGWTYLAFEAAESGGNDLPALLAALCRSSIGGGALSQALARTDAILVVLMWCAMTLAMMLPTAAPMIFTYAQIADTAARKGEHAVSPFVLTAGYVSVWLGFVIVAAALQLGLTQLSLTEAEPAAPGLLVSGAAFLAAGLYQFSRLKQACLAVCQRPFPFFFANWAVTRAGVFRLGLRQGLHCLGCCWALMLLMLATGMLNVVWMAMLGAIMTVEKMTTSPKFSRIVGLGLLAAGAACFVAFGIGVSV